MPLVPLAALPLLIWALPSLAEDCAADDLKCICRNDPLNMNCPTSINSDGMLSFCFCEYNDNKWLHVLGRFMSAFRASQADRAMLHAELSIRLETGGLLSMDVGYSDDGVAQRVQCGAPLTEVYPGTNFEVDTEEVDKLARNLMWPQVRQKLHDLCLPGRVALGLLCLHAEIGRRNRAAVLGYARQLGKLIPKIQHCVGENTPWPMPDIAEYGFKLQNMQLPADGSFDYNTAKDVSWWPDPNHMRGKRPDESSAHYWPCAPIKDPECFPSGTRFSGQSCESCCDPGKGPTGDSTCFDHVFTFARCCQTQNNMGSFW